MQFCIEAFDPNRSLEAICANFMLNLQRRYLTFA